MQNWRPKLLFKDFWSAFYVRITTGHSPFDLFMSTLLSIVCKVILGQMNNRKQLLMNTLSYQTFLEKKILW